MKQRLTALRIAKLGARCSSGQNHTFTTPLDGKKNILILNTIRTLAHAVRIPFGIHTTLPGSVCEFLGAFAES